jgi:hypothetical protein
MKQLKRWLDEAKGNGTKKVISFHAPAFARSGMGAVPEVQILTRPWLLMRKDLYIVVFNGHVHTTELYEVDGVKYLLLGGEARNRIRFVPAGHTSTFLQATRRISTGRASLPGRTTTSCTWT